MLIQEINTEESNVERRSRENYSVKICPRCGEKAVSGHENLLRLLDFSGPSSLVCNLEVSRNKRIANLPFIETDEYLLSEEVGEEWDKGLPPALFELDNSYSPAD